MTPWPASLHPPPYAALKAQDIAGTGCVIAAEISAGFMGSGAKAFTDAVCRSGDAIRILPKRKDGRLEELGVALADADAQDARSSGHFSRRTVGLLRIDPAGLEDYPARPWDRSARRFAIRVDGGLRPVEASLACCSLFGGMAKRPLEASGGEFCDEGPSSVPAGGRVMGARLGLVMLGLIWGLVVPLSGLAAGYGAGPFGLTAWVAAVSAVLNLAVAIHRRGITTLSPHGVLFFFVWAVLGTVVPQTLLFWVAGRMASSTISIIVILEGFIVFALAAVLRLEAPTFRRFLGLAIGFLGIVPVLGGASSLEGGNLPLTLLAVLGLPLCYASENVWIAAYKPAGIDPVAGIALMQAMGAVLAFALALAFDDLFWPSLVPGRLEFVILLLGICAALANYLFQSLIASSGSVFTSQCSYLITLAGIGWSMLLLGETVSPWIGVSLAVIFLGMLMVAPKAVGAVAAGDGAPSPNPLPAGAGRRSGIRDGDPEDPGKT